jgi:hypothetical protein
VLDEVAEFTAASDMPDMVRAKLHKARAFALRNGTPAEQETALVAHCTDHGSWRRREKADRQTRQSTEENRCCDYFRGSLLAAMAKRGR